MQIYAVSLPINKQTTTCLSLRNNAACCIPYLRNQRYLRENIHIRGLYQLTKIPQETLTTNCLYLRNNAACCIPYLRNLRNLRENNTQEYSIYIAQRKPQCLPQISQMTQTNHKTQSSNNHNNHNNQPVFLCEIMQLAAFICVICVICGKINTQEYSIYQHK